MLLKIGKVGCKEGKGWLWNVVDDRRSGMLLKIGGGGGGGLVAVGCC